MLSLQHPRVGQTVNVNSPLIKKTDNSWKHDGGSTPFSVLTPMVRTPIGIVDLLNIVEKSLDKQT